MRIRTVRRWRRKKFVCKREAIALPYPDAMYSVMLLWSYETWKAARAAVLGLGLVLALAACGPTRDDPPPVCPTTPVVVTKIVETRAPLPAELVEPLNDPTNDAPVVLGKTTVGEATTWAEQRRALVARCQADRAALRELQP